MTNTTYTNPSDHVQLRDLLFVACITETRVRERVKELGTMLTEDFKDKNPLFISILSGAFVFAADLIRAFDGTCEVGFVRLASYAGTHSTGSVQTVMGLEKEIKNRHVIVVEDIVDSGRTLHFFLDYLREQQPASVCTVAFLRKPEALVFPVRVDYVGFDIDDRFVVGYGLDYDGLGRNLPGLYQLVS
ncbi:MAG: hypoxanthine phosphoribosyltransferase [Saprospirales bacterium]|jgi:hypoxanthine phosphoribosyltransferase|nr:hypoxanthine phosphoribosyltransferase [Saprospirales bacterium]MBK8924204.1 hypoxanthine phosphoribosyltransferase [Saprospirales bacterium]